MDPRRIAPGLSLLIAVACGHSAPVPVEPGERPSEPRESAPASPAPAARTGEPAFQAQPGWVQETPSLPMRIAQYALPAAGGDAEDAELTVFGGMGIGGSVEDNLARWAGQFQAPDGGPSKDVIRSAPRKVGELTIHRLEVGGSYVTGAMPGGPPPRNEPDWRMLGAVIETREGPYFVKCVGPEATVRRWTESFDAFLATFDS